MTGNVGDMVELLREEILKNRREIKSSIAASEGKLMLKLEELHHRVKKLEVNNETLSNRLDALEVLSRKNNVMIFGLETPEEFSPSYICETLRKRLGLKMEVTDLNNAYRLGPNSNSPIKVEFISFLKKAEVMKASSRLRGTRLGIRNDLTYKQRSEYRTLRNHLNRARQNPSTRTFIKGNKLFIDGKLYTIEELESECLIGPMQRRVSSAPSTPSIRNPGRVLVDDEDELGSVSQQDDDDPGSDVSDKQREMDPPPHIESPGKPSSVAAVSSAPVDVELASDVSVNQRKENPPPQVSSVVKPSGASAVTSMRDKSTFLRPGLNADGHNTCNEDFALKDLMKTE